MEKTKEDIWRAYTSAWSQSDQEKRLALLSEIAEADCLYQDPGSEQKGLTGLSGYMGAFQQSVPGGHFELVDFKSHHDKSLAKWTLLNKEGQKLQEGISYGKYSAGHKLQQMTGFFY